jgi:hypothetical protein
MFGKTVSSPGILIFSFIIMVLRKIQEMAVRKKIISTIRSPEEIGPNFFLSSSMIVIFELVFMLDTGNAMSVKYNQATGINISVIGKPTLNQQKKPID